jgi:hypothetical protein
MCLPENRLSKLMPQKASTNFHSTTRYYKKTDKVHQETQVSGGNSEAGMREIEFLTSRSNEWKGIFEKYHSRSIKKKILFPFIQQKIPFDDWTGSVVKEISHLSH